jgi:hypothetical protein
MAISCVCWRSKLRSSGLQMANTIPLEPSVQPLYTFSFLKDILKSVRTKGWIWNFGEGRAWWRTSLIPALGRQRQVDFWVRGQPGLQSECQDSQGYTEKPCFGKKRKKKKRIDLRSSGSRFLGTLLQFPEFSFQTSFTATADVLSDQPSLRNVPMFGVSYMCPCHNITCFSRMRSVKSLQPSVVGECCTQSYLAHFSKSCRILNMSTHQWEYQKLRL